MNDDVLKVCKPVAREVCANVEVAVPRYLSSSSLPSKNLRLQMFLFQNNNDDSYYPPGKFVPRLLSPSPHQPLPLPALLSLSSVVLVLAELSSEALVVLSGSITCQRRWLPLKYILVKDMCLITGFSLATTAVAVMSGLGGAVRISLVSEVLLIT